MPDMRYRGRVGTFSGLRGVGGVRAGEEGRRFTVQRGTGADGR